MTKELKMLVGVALLATLALAGALGIFTFSGAQPVGAQATSTATRSFDPMTVAPGGTVTVTIATANAGSFPTVTETLPSGFTYVGSDLPADNVTITEPTLAFSLFDAPSTFTYDVTAPMATGEYTFEGSMRTAPGAAGLHVVGGAHHGNRGCGYYRWEWRTYRWEWRT